MNKNQKGFAPIVIALIILALAGAGGTSYYLMNKQSTEQTACTAEVKVCSDGSSVGRTGPNCEFVACPEVRVDETVIQTDKWIYIGHDNFWGQPNHFPTSPNYFFPKIRIYYPENWFFNCCGDTGGGSYHWIKPKDPTKESSDFYIELLDMSSSVCPDLTESCAMDEKIIATPEMKLKSVIKNIPNDAEIIPNVTLKNINTDTFAYIKNSTIGDYVKEYPENQLTKYYFIKLKEGVLRIGFVNYNKFEPGFINAFLNKLELEN